MSPYKALCTAIGRCVRRRNVHSKLFFGKNIKPENHGCNPQRFAFI